jgi:hypothetical protein
MTGIKKSIYLQAHLHEFLEKKSHEDNISISHIVQEALENYMKHDSRGIEMKLDKIREQEKKMKREEDNLRRKHQEAIEREERVQKVSRLIQAGDI